MKVQIIIGSTREGRTTPRVAKWVERTATAQLKDADVEVVDLADYDMPFFEEGLPPLANPESRVPHEAAQRWMGKLAEADGFVFVTPEYNHGMPAVLKNAIDHVDVQLQGKPATIVSHGVVGGVRSSEQLAQVLRSNVGALPIPEAVALVGMVGFNDLITEDGEANNESVKGAQGALESALASLGRYVRVLRPDA